MRALKWIGIVLLALVVSGVMLLGARIGSDVVISAQRQQSLDPFYTPPDPLPGPPGTLIRTEPLGVTVPGATAYRMLYVSELPDGTRGASGGMLFIPDGPAPVEGRPVVAWAHGTLGLGDTCAPSRSSNPLADTTNWLDQMMQLGYVVAATDYVGVGTPGPTFYLVAQSEAQDLVNAVRAARNMPDAHAGTRYVTFGHSQGGHTAVWTGHIGPAYAPELQLLGVAAAAPALGLADIMGAQWDQAAGWALGPPVMQSWPNVYPDAKAGEILSTAGQDNSERLAYECVEDAALEGFARQALGQRFFSVNPSTVPAWADATRLQTPPPMPADMPVFIAQGTTDQVVLPWPNAIIQEEWCRAGSAITMDWMGGIGHLAAATTAGPQAVVWIADRFAGRPAGRTCDVPPPVPAEVPAGQ